MKFSIITPTYKRVDKLNRAVDSLLNQTYKDWEMIIINDSPDEDGYISFEKSATDNRIKYFKNTKNEGVNYSRNRALGEISKDSDWIIFLDDDDYLSNDALESFYKLAETHNDINWFITNRSYKDGAPVTRFPKSEKSYSYAIDYLITKKCKGDATHCINTKEINNIRFLKTVKQAEEWFFFYQLGLKNKFYYHRHNSTITDGYNEASGLNFRKRNYKNEFKNILNILNEGEKLKLIYHPTFLIYLFMRLIRIIIK